MPRRARADDVRGVRSLPGRGHRQLRELVEVEDGASAGGGEPGVRRRHVQVVTLVAAQASREVGERAAILVEAAEARRGS